MADAYVYYFTVLDESTGHRVRSKRLATLETIKGRGEPVMETQTTVDETELDDGGFLVGRSVGGLHLTDELWGEIRSLNLRAASRDREALELEERTEGRRKYLLSVESRELRNQAKRLQKERSDILAAELSKAVDLDGIEPCGVLSDVG
jgi:hypothetical protein